MFGITPILVSCGSSDDDDPVVALDNGLLSGEYQWHTVEFEWDHMNITSAADASADGQGTVTLIAPDGTFDVPYTVYAADRSLMIVPGGTAENEYGRVSSDGNVAIITDAQYVDPYDQRDVETHLLIRKSTDVDMTLARMSGEYIVSQIGQNAPGYLGYYTSQVEVVLNSDGTGTWEILNHSQLTPVGNTGNFNVSVATDGTFTVTPDPDPGYSDVGIIDPDANIFVMTDDDMADGDGEQIFAIGIRKSTVAPAFLTGTYQMNFFGYDFSVSPYGQFAARWNAVEDELNLEFDITVIIDSRGTAPGTTGSFSHTPVASDGRFVIGAGLGIVSPDGGYFAIVDTDLIDDDEMKIGFAIP
jgi:hypothetical protein